MALYALIGYPLSHSLSFRINNAILNELGDFYIPFETQEGMLNRVVEALRVLSRGFNVTIPYKKSILVYLDEVSEEVRMIGAANAVKVFEDRLLGYNTDYLAIKKLSKDVQGSSALIYGAGGAASASAYALFSLGFNKFYIFNRTRDRAEALAKRISLWGAKAEVVEGPVRADVFVNATPLGMYYDDSQLLSFFRKGGYSSTIDLAYSLNGTNLQKASKVYVSGLDILIEQAALSIEIWKGIAVDREKMRSVLREG